MTRDGEDKVASFRLYAQVLLSEGCGRPRRPCPRLLHNEPFRLAVVTAFSLKSAAPL